MLQEDFIKGLQNASCEIDEERENQIVEILRRSIKTSHTENPEIPDGHHQLIIAMEELSELQKEVSKELRGKGNRLNILEEVADVYIILKYIKLICGLVDSDIRKAINVKMDRLEDILDKEGIYN